MKYYTAVDLCEDYLELETDEDTRRLSLIHLLEDEGISDPQAVVDNHYLAEAQGLLDDPGMEVFVLVLFGGTGAIQRLLEAQKV